MEFVFDMEKNKDKIESFELFIKEHEDKPGALMQVLQEAQNSFGYLPIEMLELTSKGLKIPMAEIYGVATFYSQFSFIPKGENNIHVCLGTACYVKGAQAILEEIEDRLGIKQGGTTTDMKFSINPTRCIGDCSLAPVILINDDVYPRIKTSDVKDILAKY